MLWGYVAALGAGTVMGVLGGGGSILSVPILVYFMNVDPVRATAYSLFAVGTTAAVGAIRYFRRGLLDLKTGFGFALFSFLGVFVSRGFLVPALPDPVLRTDGWELSKGSLLLVAFALMMLAASVSMVRGRPDPGDSRKPRPGRWKVGGVSLMIGIATGFVGAGGGFLIVPALTVGMGLPMKVAVGTSLGIIAFNSTFGFLGDLRHITFQWGLLLSFSGALVLGVLAGSRLASRVPGQKLKPMFGWFVLVVGLSMLIKELL